MASGSREPEPSPSNQSRQESLAIDGVITRDHGVRQFFSSLAPDNEASTALDEF